MTDTAHYMEIVRSISEEKFAEIFSASSRSARETYLHRHGIKSPKKSGRILRAGQKNEIRMKLLFKALKDTDDNEMVEEILRTWLLGKRTLLAGALDHLGIEHNEGLTDSDDIERFEKLSEKEVKSLVSDLSSVAEVEEISIYLKYMGAKNVDKALQ